MADGDFSKERKNYFKAAEGLQYAGVTLEQYTKTKLRVLHQTIYRKLANYPECQQQCSQSHGKNFTRWCNTCRRWKQELEAESRNKWRFSNVDWAKIQSSSWNSDYKSIANLFLRPGWIKPNSPVDLRDLATALSLWDNCSRYSISLNVIKKLRYLRNTYVAHNTNMEISDDKMTVIFNVLRALFHETDLKTFIKINKCNNDLQRISERSFIDRELASYLVESVLPQIQKEYHEIRYSLSNIENQLTNSETFEANLEETLEHFKRQERKSNYKQPFLFRVLIGLSALFVFIIFVLRIWVYQKQTTRDLQPSQKNLSICIEESYSIPFTPEMLLEDYLLHQGQYVERKWLMKELQTEIFSSNFSKKGVMIMADIGYGKTVFVSQLVCADQSKYTWSLHNQILAYHVCKFDVMSTKNPSFFIRRLIGMIGLRLPEFGNQVSMLENTSIVFDRSLCEFDPNGCFDQGILFPLNHLIEFPAQRQIIILDALDECSEGYGGLNKIADLIRKRAHKLPLWIVLLITSRNVSEYIWSKDMSIKHLLSNDPRNLNDIRIYIEEMEGKSVSTLKTVFGINADDILIEKLVNASGGNFQFLTHALDFWLATNATVDSNIPATLDRIYELNFERIFGTKSESFRDAKLVLEAACASFYQLRESEIFDMFSKSNSTNLTNVQIREALDRLSMFLKTENGFLMFTHISIRSWLLSRNNVYFSVSTERGATILSEYLLYTFQLNNNSSNLTQLILHVSASNNIALEAKFKTIIQNKTIELMKQNVLHEIAEMIDSPKAIDLIANYYENIDTKNEDLLPASFVAARKGHAKSFKRLIDLGANINLTFYNETNPFYLLPHFIADEIFTHHSPGQFIGNNLLHIASEYGHLSIVEYIISKSKSLMNSKNSLGYLPVHIACKHGRGDIVNYFYRIQNMAPDILCLYLATQNEHESIVKEVLDRGISFYQCISYKEAAESFQTVRITDISNRFNTSYNTRNVSKMANKTKTIQFSNELVRPLDIWWKIHQDTPLHLAVRKGNLVITSLIISAVPESLNCSDSGGLTPFLTSIRYQKTKIFKQLLNKRWFDTCSGSSQIYNDLIMIYGYNKMASCVKDMQLTHFLAQFGNQDMISHMLEFGHELDFTSKDTNGATSLHYAACAGNIHFLGTAIKKSRDLSVSSANGSTPYHSAAGCYSYVGMYVLSKFNEIPFALDSSNMSLGIYLVSAPMQNVMNYSDKERETSGISILQIILNVSLHFITNRDHMQRNIFHYALRNGHYIFVQYLLSTMADESIKLLLDTDINGEDPVEYGVQHLDKPKPHNRRIYYYPKDCSYIDLFRSKECMKTTRLESLMTPQELSLLYVMMYPNDTLIKRLFVNHLREFIVKSKMYLVPYFILRIARQIKESKLKRQVFQALKDPEAFNILTVIILYPEILIHCDKDFSQPPLHKLSSHMDRILIESGLSAVSIYKMIQDEKMKMIIWKCLDNDGHTLLQKAIEEKSFIFAGNLIRIYSRQANISNILDTLIVSIVHTDLTTVDDRIAIQERQMHDSYILEHVLASKILNYEAVVISIFTNDIFTAKLLTLYNTREDIANINTTSLYQDLENATFTYDFQYSVNTVILKDTLITNLISDFKNDINFGIFCLNNSNTLSLVHLIAANNMFATMSAIRHHAPTSVLKCTNKHGVTPLYLAKMFKAENVLQLYENESSMTFPHRDFEEVLLLKLVSGFIDSNEEHPLFYLQNISPKSNTFNEMGLYRKFKPLHKAKVTCKLYKFIYSKYIPLFRVKYLRYIYSMMSMMSSILSGRHKVFPCFIIKFHLVFYQGFIRDITSCQCFPRLFASYSYLWKDTNLFKDCEKCKVLKRKFHTISAFKQFSTLLLKFLIEKFHEYLHSVAIKEIKMLSSARTFYRQDIYFRKLDSADILRTEFPLSKDLLKFRYIDILKGTFIKRFGKIYPIFPLTTIHWVLRP